MINDMLNPGFSTEPYFETVARSLVARFGSDTLDVVNRTIERLEVTGPEDVHDVWLEVRSTLLRKSPGTASRQLQ